MINDSSKKLPKTGARRGADAILRGPLVLVLAALLAAACSGGQATDPAARADAAPEHGGRLVVALRGEPRTFNPVTAVDRPSKLVIGRLMADLLHINRATLEVEAALADSWTISEDSLTYRLQLRRDVRFSDGEPFDADDVIFSFRVYLDEEVAYPGRDLLVIGGHPIEPRKIDSHTVEFRFTEPTAVGLRLFDDLSMLPRHQLEEPYEQGRLAELWGPATAPDQIAGLGPFRLREFRAGERLVLERNPNYWKTDADGDRLPYLDELTLLFVANEDAQVIRFKAGETDLIENINASNFAELDSAGAGGSYEVRDLGAGLSYMFLALNQNELGADTPTDLELRQQWFRQRAFRLAVSAAVDREAVTRLAYRNRATPLWSHVSPGYEYWFNDQVPRPKRSLERARDLLATAGFSWQGDDSLVDPTGQPVQFSIMTTAGNSQRLQAATLVQEDLRQLGMQVSVVPLEQGTLVDRLLVKRDYDACLLELNSGDADPNTQINILLSSGGLHVWQLGEPQPATSWEAEIDQLMRSQISTMDRAERKRQFDRVQMIMAEQAPVVFLASPHVLTGAKRSLGNFNPAVLAPNVLWNVDEIYWREHQT